MSEDVKVEAQEQGVKEAQDTQVVEKENSVPISRFNEVIKERNELRNEVTNFKTDAEQARAKKLEEEGEFKTLLAEERNKSTNLGEQLNSTKEELNSYITDEKNRLLDKLPEDKRDKYKEVDLSTLRNVVDDFSEVTKKNLKSSEAGLQRKSLPENPFKELSEDDQRKNWQDVISSYSK